jgi:hypothetical protein
MVSLPTIILIKKEEFSNLKLKHFFGIPLELFQLIF